MKISKNFDEISFSNKFGSLIINNKKKRIIARSITNNYIEPNIDNNIHLHCTTGENQPIETYNHTNINLNFKKQSKLIYYKNKLKRNLLFNNNLNNTLDKRPTLNTIDFKDGITPTNKIFIESKINKYIVNNNTLRKNNTGLQLNKNFFEKINNDNVKGKNINKSLKNLKLNYNKINLHSEKDKIINSFKKIKNNNKLIKIKDIINKKDEDIQNLVDIEEEIINSNNKNDDVMSKELFNLLVKRLNKNIEDNEKDQKIIKKLKEENNKLKQKLLLESKKNETALKKKFKELFEIKKNRDFLKKENEKLREEILKLIMKIKENYNNKLNKDKQIIKEDNMQLNQLDSICSSIGGLSAFSINSIEK